MPKEYIESEALREDVKNHFKKLIDEGYVYDEIFDSNAEISRIIDEQPTADVAEVKHGKWIFINQAKSYFDGPYGDISECSLCGHKVDVSETNYNYCPNCGAKMDKEWVKC